jgi:hypothetical protein
MMWNVRKARAAAWTNGELLWHLRATPLLRANYLTQLDQMTAFAGRGLLVPRLGIGSSRHVRRARTMRYSQAPERICS